MSAGESNRRPHAAYAGAELRMVLIPFDAREALTLQKAAKIATVSETTIARWCKKPGIGRKIGGAWRVSRVALQMMLDDNGWALVAYLNGDRTSQRVTRYFLDLGLGDILPTQGA
jgi:Helix-turn-helix domain